MGATSAETEREIVALRREITDAASELDHRVNELLDVKARSQDLAEWALQKLDSEPRAVAGAALGACAGAVFLGVGAVMRRRRKKSAAGRLASLRDHAHDEAARRIEEAVSQARELLAAGGARVAALSAEEPSQSTKSQDDSSMLKKLLWTGLTAGSLALAGLLARRLSISIWQSIMHEDPPTASA